MLPADDLSALEQPHQAQGEGALAATRFARDAERLPRLDREADAVHRPHDGAGRVVVGPKRVDGEQGHLSDAPV